MAKQVPELPFGAVIVRRATGVIVAEGHNRSSESPTFHGEIVVINRCATDHPSIDWAEVDLYTTAEPCPMCQSAIEWAGIPTVYYGTSIPYLQRLGWKQIEIRAKESCDERLFVKPRSSAAFSLKNATPCLRRPPRANIKGRPKAVEAGVASIQASSRRP
ncbi:MAG: nucleoside deaminase [Pseudomonadota bacterium]|nr:nucleoside deaminase [Pseudomonadota bacterium]